MSKLVADEEALNSYADYVNTNLYAVGIIDAKLEFGANEDILTAFYSMLKYREKEEQEHQVNLDKLHVREKEYQYLLKEKRQLLSKIDAHEKSLDSYDRIMSEYKAEFSKYRGTAEKGKEELSKLVLSLQTKDTQFAHDKRRLERELTRTQARLRKLITAKGENVSSCIEIHKGSWKKNEELASFSGLDLSESFVEPAKISDVILTAYENEKEQLMDENLQLRSSLENLQTELGAILSEGIDAVGDSAKDSGDRTNAYDEEIKDVLGNIVIEELPTGVFQLPFSIAKPRIEEHILKSVQVLRRARTKMRLYIQEREKEQNVLKVNASLKNEIQQYQSIIEELEKLLKLALDLQISVKRGSMLSGKSGAREEEVPESILKTERKEEAPDELQQYLKNSDSK